MMKKQNLYELRSKAHALKPVVIVGQHGVTQGVQNEIAVALEAHELIKIRLSAGDSKQAHQMIDSIIDQHQAKLVQHIGHVITIYKPSEKLALKRAKKLSHEKLQQRKRLLKNKT